MWICQTVEAVTLHRCRTALGLGIGRAGDDAPTEPSPGPGSVPAGVHHWPFDRARVELAYGEHLRRQRAMTAPRVRLIAALEVFERLGATPWSDHARAELQSTG